MTTNETMFASVSLKKMSTVASPDSICLCLGPKQSGKTHLLLSLKNRGSITTVSHSVPTIGTNIYTIRFPVEASNASAAPTAGNASATCNKQKAAAAVGRQQRSTKTSSITIMEIGGSMAPMWTNYLANVSKILYVIDTSNLCQISAAGEPI